MKCLNCWSARRGEILAKVQRVQRRAGPAFEEGTSRSSPAAMPGTRRVSRSLAAPYPEPIVPTIRSPLESPIGNCLGRGGLDRRAPLPGMRGEDASPPSYMDDPKAIQAGRGILSARMQRVPWCHGRRRTRTESGLGSRSQEGLGREIVLRAQERYSRKRSASVSALGRKAHGRDRPRHDDEFRSPDVGRATTTRPRRSKQLSAPTAPPCGGRRFHQSIRYRHQRFPTRRFRCKAP